MTAACARCGFDPGAPLAGSWTLFLPVMAQSQNKLGANKGGKRWSYAALRTDFELAVMAEARKLRIPRAKHRRRLMLVRHYAPGQAPFDHGNLVGGMKPCLDAFVRQGMLVSDAPAWLEDHYAQRPAIGLRVGVLALLEEFAR